MNKKKLIIIGGKGNGTVVASAVEDFIDDNGGWEILGFLNDFAPQGVLLNNLPVLGKTDQIEKYNKPDCYFIYTLLSATKGKERKEKLIKIGIPTEKYATFVHPAAVVSRHSKLGYGNVIMPNVVISPNVQVGNYTHVYANSLIGHDTIIGDYSFIANCVSVGSGVVIKQGVHIGSNASILEKVIIGEWSLVGLGSVVLKDVPAYAKVVGNPAKSIGDVNK